MDRDRIEQSKKEDNIFDLKIWNSSGYLVFYIFLPVLVTGISLFCLSGNSYDTVYFYLTVLISSLNCIYDGSTRWKSNDKCFRNTKLLIICIAAGIVACYCVAIVLFTVVSHRIPNTHNLNYFFLAYLGVIIVGFEEITKCWAECVALSSCA